MVRMKLGEMSDLSMQPYCPLNCSKESRMSRHGDVLYCTICGSVFDKDKRFVAGWKNRAVELEIIKIESHLNESINNIRICCPFGRSMVVYENAQHAYCDCFGCNGRFYNIEKGVVKDA